MQIRPTFTLLLCLFVLATQSCFKAKPIDPDEVNVVGDLEWFDTEGFASIDPIKNIHGTPFELHVLTNSEFIRLNADNVVLFKRQLLGLSNVNGRPAMDDNVFSRIIKNNQNQEILEFHLTKNPADIQTIIIPDLENAGDVDVDRDVRNMGAFNDEGNLFLLPCIKGDAYVFYLFELELTMEADNFVDVQLIKIIDVPDLLEGENMLQNMKYLNGYFWIATKEGGFRITDGGDLMRIFSMGQYKLDYFTVGDTIYSVAFNDYDMTFSTNDGLDWTRIDERSFIRNIETVKDGNLKWRMTSY